MQKITFQNLFCFTNRNYPQKSIWKSFYIKKFLFWNPQNKKIWIPFYELFCMDTLIIFKIQKKGIFFLKIFQMGSILNIFLPRYKMLLQVRIFPFQFLWKIFTSLQRTCTSWDLLAGSYRFSYLCGL